MEQRIIIYTGDNIFTLTKNHRLEMEVYDESHGDYSCSINLLYKSNEDTCLWMGSKEEGLFIMERIMKLIVDQMQDSVIVIKIPAIIQSYNSI